MHCQYHIIFFFGCSHIISVDESHKLSNCDENRGWTVEYDTHKCPSCTTQDTSENLQLIPPTDNQLLTEEDLAHRLETLYLEPLEVDFVKLEAELVESLERRFLQVPKDNRLKMDAEISLLLFLKEHGRGNTVTEQDVKDKDRLALNDEKHPSLQ